MTIEFVQGNIFDSGAEALVNPVNCVGVMGKGLAAEFKRRYPAYFAYYRGICENKNLKPGGVFVYQQPSYQLHKYIISFATKNHWKDPSKFFDIRVGIPLLIVKLVTNKIKSVAVPALGCGLGGLEWSEVKALMTHWFSGCPTIYFKIYEPLEAA